MEEYFTYFLAGNNKQFCAHKHKMKQNVNNLCMEFFRRGWSRTECRIPFISECIEHDEFHSGKNCCYGKCVKCLY